MKILKYLLFFLIIYLIGNISYWVYQEYIYYDDMQTIKSLGNTINVAMSLIEEKKQVLDQNKKSLDEQKVTLDNLLNNKKYNEYNELVIQYNQDVYKFNKLLKEYQNLLNIQNQNIRTINNLILKSGTRKYLFPIRSYTPTLYKEL